jgi:hypothetical protein
MASKYVILWHGTSKSRANSIVKTGFYANSFFAKPAGIARGYASAKRKQDDPGVLVLCAVDLTPYKKRDYEARESGRIYHFIPPVARNAVAGIFRIDEFTGSELKEKANLLRNQIRKHRFKKFKIGYRRPEIVITRNCSAEAIAYWINTYLSMRTNRRINVTHPGIAQISAWIKKNYTNGRISPISDPEMLIQSKRYVPELFGNIRAASTRLYRGT